MKKHLFMLCLAFTGYHACSQLPAYVPGNALVAWWPFTGNANDASGNGHNGTNNGASLTTDRFNNPNSAYNFNGSTAFIDVPDDPVLNLTNTDFTINAWVLANSFPWGWNQIFIKDISSGNSEPKYLFCTSGSGDGSLAWHINGPGLGGGQWWVSTPIYVNQWCMLTAEKSGDSILFYINATLVSVQNFTTPIPSSTGVDARIGGPEPNGEGAWDGDIDDLGVWTRALSPCELEALYLADTIVGAAITANGATSFCEGDSLILQANSGNSYAWNSADTSQSITVYQSNTYTVTVTDANGCSISASQTVTVNPLPVISVQQIDGPSCGESNGSAAVTVLSGIAPFTYLWSNDSIDSIIGNVRGGTYTVTVADANACSTSATQIVTVNTLPVINVQQIDSATCGESNGSAGVTVLSGTGPFTYLWSNNSIDSIISNIPGGKYIVTVWDSSGCSATDSTSISSSSSAGTVTITSDKSIMCADDSAHICVTGGYASYIWSSGSVDSCIYVYTAGDYYLTVTNQNNCTAASNHLEINVYQSPTVQTSARGDTLIAYNAANYQWFWNDTAIPGADSSIYIVSQSGSYFVRVSDTNGCTESSQAILISVSGIEALSGNEWIKVYPNPSTAGSGWQLSVSEGLTGSIMEIYDDNARLIYKAEIRNRIFDISPALSHGVYTMKVTYGNASYSLKLIKM